MHYIHSSGFAHGDLTLSNMYLDNHYQIKIGDFSLASPLAGQDQDRPGKHTAIQGTPNYMAPEIIQAMPYSADSADMFALGVALFSMNSGFYPFQKASESD